MSARRQIKRSDLPKDFDWKFYLDNHKDLTIAGLSTEKDAMAHYVMFGNMLMCMLCM